MEKKLIGYMFLLSFVFVNTAEAQFKDLKKLNPLGGGDEKESPVDVEGAQAKLLDALADALGDVYAAQAIIAEAQGNKELAATYTNTSKDLSGGGVDEETLKGAVLDVAETTKANQEVFNKKEQMDSESKKLYAKALLPYVKSVAKTAKLSEPISDFMDQAQNSIKSIKNPMQLRKLKSTLDTGLFVGKNVPKLIVSLGKSSKDLLTYAKDNGIDTSNASSALGDDDEFE